ncbi:MAG: pilus assembly protein PilM [Phycisphaerae bacterium]
MAKAKEKAMIKRCIGIDIGYSHLRAVQLARTEQELHIEKTFSTQIRRNTDSPPDILKSLISRHGFDSRAAIATSVPQDAVFFRNLETDFAGLEQIRQHDSAALEHDFPLPADEIVTQVYSYRQLPDGRFSVLTVAVSKESLRQRRNLLAEAKIPPDLAETAIFAVHAAVVVNHPEIKQGLAIIAHVDESYLTLAVTQDNNILIVRNLRLIPHPDSSVGSAQEQIIEVLSGEAKISWRKIFGTEIEPDSRLYLVTGGGVSDDLKAAVEQKLPCQTIFVDPYANIKRSPDCQADGTMCLAEGLALRLLAPEKTAGVNFLQADNGDRKPTLNLKKELVICAALVSAIAVFLLVGLFVRLFYMERNYARIRNEIREVFRTALPEEKNIVNPLVQLEQKMESFRKDYQLFATFHPTSLATLEVLRIISTSVPFQAGFKVDDLLITPSSVRVSGTCDSFESVYRWQEFLQKVPGFALVDVQDAQKEAQSDVVRFTILISSAKSPSLATSSWQTSPISQ